MKKVYLTIDDSPSKNTDDLTDFLKEKNIPAVFFVRGQSMDPEQGNKEAFQKIVRTIQKGFTVANHSYAHERTSEIGFESQTQQIAKTQNLIDLAYQQAGKEPPPRYFRFPHLDRGCGNAWVIDFETIPEQYRDYVQHLFWDGVRLETKEPPTKEQKDLKIQIQHWLTGNGFIKFPTPDVTLPWWVGTELETAIDCLITFSTSDWMLTPRHLGKWSFKTTAEIQKKIDSDPWLNREDSAHIVLIHDDREDLLTVTENLVNHMLHSNFIFKEA
ncbi:MAG: polysaccharide deacetylase family protein [Alphaproteobacteria bacterium]|jgi:peptidoglycan/xylan/chitin deacetylase (PgdA/CDA1 family)|nr:polysaccharide deacetylase family protein [Alphaproteobacteria bacterium]MCB1552077.1 polysaccharide deacetylase family protein [Alphaproteobacteria bacterium]MCB9985816.1 polysaccharide deacetylase family protein [Micavibrio sp.]HPQ50042.1 polysaccharide deacetylase family protein [Alphaproteobacteria bacterium]HRK97550.1 polysaccharide deacetylase family protein [Alphaproteobacteria bacterium]